MFLFCPSCIFTFLPSSLEHSRPCRNERERESGLGSTQTKGKRGGRAKRRRFLHKKETKNTRPRAPHQPAERETRKTDRGQESMWCRGKEREEWGRRGADFSSARPRDPTSRFLFSSSLLLAQDVGHLVALGLAALVGAQLALGELEGALLAAGLCGLRRGGGRERVFFDPPSLPPLPTRTHTHTHSPSAARRCASRRAPGRRPRE